MRSSNRLRCATLVEVLMCFMLLSLVIFGVIQAFRYVGGEHFDAMGKRLALQMEARRALLNVYSTVQDGIELMKPDPGSTLPFLVFRDYINNIHFMYLKKDLPVSEKTGCDIFRLYSSVYNITTGDIGLPREILAQVERLNFTAHGYSSVLVTCTLREGKTKFSLINMIRLKNASAREG